MTKIRVLSDLLINKIAAGEIVERPASVVKELVENSLDANAGKIDITVERGGKSRIVIRDDGDGMNRDDALLAFEHHATSKIQTIEDLQNISSLGFRGEALPSIASVSRLILRTAESSPDQEKDRPGTQIEIHGGVIKSVKDIPWAGGTEITVGHLFYNIPARKKFLKADNTESAHIARLVTHYALSKPEIYFSLIHNTRKTMDAPPVKTLKERTFQIFGEQFLDRMIPLDETENAVRIFGMISQPHQRRSSTDAQYYFVNGRMVRDRVLTIALSQVYRGLLPSGTYPAAVLFVEIPPEEIDVNVHPAKTEIRFRQSWHIQSFFRRAMETALHRSRSFAQYQGREPSGEKLERIEAKPASGDELSAPDGYSHRVKQRVEEYYTTHDKNATVGGQQHSFQFRPGSSTDSQDMTPDFSMPVPSPAPSTEDADISDSPADRNPWRVLGQWNESYIVAANREEMVIIDQHVAHERVLYEEVLRQMAAGDVVQQKLLMPITLELTPSQVLILNQLMERFESNGFEMEPFGQRSILVKAVPALASQCEIRQLILEILERVEDVPGDYSVEEVKKRVAAGLACRAAVKINTPLSEKKMEYLLDRLMGAEDPTTCPHGRPVVLRIHLRDLEKNFKRA